MDTVRQFGRKPPSVNRTERQKQLAKLLRTPHNLFDAEEKASYANVRENLDVLLVRYNLANLAGRKKQREVRRRQK